MEPKKRLLIVVAVTVLILCAMGVSFGRSIFARNTPSVTLPDRSDGVSDSDGTHAAVTPSDRIQPVEVTPDTVQNVVATLARPDSCAMELTVETFWGEDGSAAQTVHVWQDGGWTHVRKQLPSAVVRHDLIGPDAAYYWYEGSRKYKTCPPDDASADLAQRIPTYESVLQAQAEEIRSAGYEKKNDRACIRVEVESGSPAIRTCYWVEVASGLLTAAEQEQDGKLIYRMTVSDLQQPCPAQTQFALPEGTVLHTSTS